MAVKYSGPVSSEDNALGTRDLKKFVNELPATHKKRKTLTAMEDSEELAARKAQRKMRKKAVMSKPGAHSPRSERSHHGDRHGAKQLPLVCLLIL